MAEGNQMTDERTRIASAGTPIDPRSVVGWGVDANPDNDPTYPYRDRSADQGLTNDWQRPVQQASDIEVLQSIEHVRRPAVFGTSTPPTGLSGMIRRVAFRWSESNWLHWLMLMGADRINVVEGVVEDLGRGKVPNIPAEMGARAEWKHNKKGFVIKTAVVLGATAGLIALIRSRRASGQEGEAQMRRPAPLIPPEVHPVNDRLSGTNPPDA
jgi:hypothetical protein